MVIGGFSGRATHCLASGLRGITGQLWPPSYDTGELQVGAFIVRFEFAGSGSEPADGFDPEWMFRPSATEVIPLEEKVLSQKVQKKQRK